MTVMFEFVRQSTFASTLTTLLPIVRAAGHPNIGVLFDCYHFWSGLNKLEDLDLLRPGEVKHVHFQDVPDMPREMLDMTTRFIPGDGVYAATRHPAQARRQGLRRTAVGRALPAAVPGGRSVRDRPRDQAEGRGGDAPRQGALTVDDLLARDPRT